MAEKFYGSICLSDIIEAAKQKHSAFSKAENGKIYFNINVWVNDAPDKYGNSLSLQLNSTKEAREEKGKVYIGNAKRSEKKEVEAKDVEDILDDLPF